MIHVSIPGTAAVLLVVLLQQGSAGREALAFHVDVDTTRSLSVKKIVDLELVTGTLIETYPGEPSTEKTLSNGAKRRTEESVEAIDIHYRVGKGWPTLFDREYREAILRTQSIRPESDVKSWSQQSPIGGITVHFSRDADGAYDRSIDTEVASKPAISLLDGLQEDLYCTFLLPPNEATADSWMIPLDNLPSLLDPVGNLWPSKKPTSRPDSTEKLTLQATQAVSVLPLVDLLQRMDGKIAASHEGLEQIDGKSLAIISVNVDVRSNAQLEDDLRCYVERGIPPGIKYHYYHSVEAEIHGTARILWDVHGKQLNSCSFECDLTIHENVRLTADMVDPSTGKSCPEFQMQTESQAHLATAISSK